MIFPRQNNFDLLRLFAAMQVFAFHLLNHFNVLDKYAFLPEVLNQFPGVPIFFFISGFLITASFNKPKSSLNRFFKNRALRIFPALWVCLLFTIVLLAFFDKIEWSNYKFYVWIIAQMTFFQSYSPQFLNSWGIGNPNGSLWSIVVELQFYLIIPFLCMFLNKQKSLLKINFTLLILFLSTFFLFYYLNITIGNNPYFDLSVHENQQKMLLYKILSTSIICNLYFFIVGIFFYYNYHNIKILFEGKAAYWIFLYVLFFSYFAIYKHAYLNPYFYNIHSVLALIILAFTTFSIAFTYNSLAEKLLKHNDISYGIYIYHMPVINTILALNIKGALIKLLISIIIVINLAIISWIFIEKKAISFKKA